MHPDRGSETGLHLDEDTCLDLVTGLLPADERRAALAHVSTCAACERRLKTIAATHEIGRARANATLAATAVRSERPVVVTVPLPSLPAAPDHRGGRARMWLAAASIVAIAGAAWLAGHRSPSSALHDTPTAHRLPEVDDGEILRQRSGEATDSLILAGVAAYSRGDFVAATRLLDRPHPDGGMDRLRRVYLAGALLELRREPEAFVVLDGTRAVDLPEPWREESEWMRVVVWHRLGLRASADSLARQLATGSGPVAERARRLLSGALAKP
jgi:hypothetical protein